MKNALKIFSFTILVALFYSYVGQMVPQKVTYPPEETALSADMSTEEMVAAGQQIVEGKGTCMSCHTIGEHSATLRFPDLDNVGAVASTRKEGMDDVEYLAESLYEPNAYIVEGFQGGMPVISKPPIALSDQEILTVIAYLQSLGGTPSVTMDTELRWQGQEPQPTTTTTTASAGPTTSGADGPTLFNTYACATCHTLDGSPGAGPSLQGLGQRLTQAEIYEAIMAPDAVVAEGFAPGVMPAMLSANGFYDNVSAKDVQTLVDWLAEQ